MKGKVRTALIVLLLAVFLFSAYQIWDQTRDYRTGRSAYQAMAQYAVLPEQPDPDDGLPWPEVDFDALREVNPDIVGWIYSEDTPIHYPVVQGEDNEFYLHHLFDGSAGRTGCIFLEAQNAPDFSEPHSILYGHHMRDGSMFKSLKYYQEQDYYEEHPILLLETPEKWYRLEVFAGRVASTDSDAWQLDFESPEERQKWIDRQMEQSVFHSDVVPGAEERILTLSTCSYEFQNARFVVHCVLRERGS
jgi:sortase B